MKTFALTVISFAVVLSFSVNAQAQTVSPQTIPLPAAEIPKYAEFNKPETFVWVKWDATRKAAKAIPSQDTGSAVLGGEGVGCFGPGDEIKVTNPRLLRILKDGLENAECPYPPITPPGAIYRSGIEFYAKNSKKPFEPRNARFPFLAWWPSLSYGPRFWNALKTFSHWYAEECRNTLLRIKPQTIDTIDLEYTNDGFTELTTTAEITHLLRTAITLDDTAYNVTDKTRVPVRLVLWTKPTKERKKSTSRTFYLLIRTGKTAKHSSFSQSVYSYFRASLKGDAKALKYFDSDK